MAVTITEYLRPHSLNEALALLGDPRHHRVPVGGGVSIVLSGAPHAVHAVELAGLGLDGIELTGNKLAIGAMATLSQVIESPVAGRLLNGVVAKGLRTAATRPLRNQVTVGGNVVQCYYWSTMPVILMGLGGSVCLASEKRRRTISAEEFFAAHPVKQLQRGEIVLRVEIPVPGGRAADATSSLRWGASYLKCAATGNDYGLVNVCVLLGLDKGTVKKARVALGAIGTLPVRCPEAEKFLLRKTISEDTARKAALLAVADIEMRAHMRADREYRRKLAAAWLSRAICAAGKDASAR